METKLLEIFKSLLPTYPPEELQNISMSSIGQAKALFPLM